MEKVLFRKDDIEVSDSIARFGSSSYPIKNIGMVSTERALSVFLVVGILAGVACGILLFIGIEMYSSYGQVQTGAFGAAFMCFLGGVFCFLHGVKESGTRLVLKTSSGNEQVFKSSDSALVSQIKSAIETAVSSRS